MPVEQIIKVLNLMMSTLSFITNGSSACIHSIRGSYTRPSKRSLLLFTHSAFYGRSYYRHYYTSGSATIEVHYTRPSEKSILLLTQSAY